MFGIFQDNGDTAVSTTTARDRKYSSDSHTSRSLSTPDNGLENGKSHHLMVTVHPQHPQQDTW